LTTPYWMGVDIGTYSSKGVIVDGGGGVIASHAVPHELSLPRPGYFEHDAEAVWWHDFVAIVRSLLRQTGLDPRRIGGIGASGIGSCVLPIDENGAPLRPAILYGIDTRASAEIAYLEQALGREAIFRRGAMHLSSQASGPKVLWIRNHEPQVFEQARWFLTSQAYLVYKLTGQASIDVYTAGGYIPLYDVYRRAWVPEAAALITPLERLPRACWSAEVVGQVTPEAARATGLAPGTPVVAGTTDAAAEALSAGVAHFGDLMLMFGSSLFFILKTAQLLPTERFWSSNFLEEGTYAFTGGMSTAGSLTTWFRDQLAPSEVERERAGGENAYAALARAAAASPPGARGLIALPYFEGERTPLQDPQAKGLWFGLSLKHSRADLYRSLLEGVAFGIRHNLSAMAEEGVAPASRILAVGGGAQSQTWMQIVADVCNLELALPDQAHGACYGDAFLAAAGAGGVASLGEIGRWVQTRAVVRPDGENHRRYEAYYRLYRELYSATEPLMHRLAEHVDTGEATA
jgi:xylulokinase